MTGNFDSKRECSLLTRALHELAKACWGDFVLIDSSNKDGALFVLEETKEIIAHRKTVIERIPETFSSTLPITLQDQLVDAVIRIERGYREVLFCTKLHTYTLSGLDASKFPLVISGGLRFKGLTTLLITNPLITGFCSAKNFIDPTGHFNELAWAKSIVSDESRSALSRFELACFYCFEETIKDLWCSTIIKSRHPYEGGFLNILEKSYRYYLVAIWVCRLENKFDQVVREVSEFADGFYVGGFRIAIKWVNEYALRFFWAGCSETEKVDLVNDIMEDERFYVYAFLGFAGIVNFIYSLLSLEDKKDLIEYNRPDIWSCLLLSPFYESVLNDILTLPFPTSNRAYAQILEEFTFKMKQLPISDYKKIFEALWKPLPQEQRIEVLQNGPRVINDLTELKDMDLLEIVIRPFSPSVKERMLLYDWQYAGMSALDGFARADDYDTMLRYLLLFLVDRDPVTNRLSVWDGATDLLDRFTNGDVFVLWARGLESERRKEVEKVIVSLHRSLRFLNSML